MRILYINISGGGYAAHIEVADGITVAQLFEKQLPHEQPEDFLIRVDRLPAAAEQVLLEGQRVTFTPVKIEGARVAA